MIPGSFEEHEAFGRALSQGIEEGIKAGHMLSIHKNTILSVPGVSIWDMLSGRGSRAAASCNCTAKVRYDFYKGG